ncbi:MAG: hypothetical protein EA401_06490 [Planctomycetota bacterium]|nr:MAG: hypothetical protein EA401_06490 [Planctomycetota bacterium]
MSTPQPATLHVDCSRSKGLLPRLWAHTGFTPATALLRPTMHQALQWYGALPEGGLRHCRIHYLLDLLSVKGLETGGEPVYDWSRFDEGFDHLVHNGLAPFVELMGDPTAPRVEDGEQDMYGLGRKGRICGWFTDFSQPEQSAAWRRIVGDVAKHCIERYGQEEVRSWYWETWNEPDEGWWKQSTDALNAYTRACIEGLHDADPELRFGGPGTCHTMSKTLVEWLAYADEENLPLAFISVHEKGASGHAEDLAISTPRIVERTRQAVAHVREHHPKLAKLPFMNNECDPIVGWGYIHPYHARPWHAAWALRVQDLHLRTLVDEDGVDLQILGNDHGFVGSWGMRTLLTTIGIAPKGEDRMFPRHMGGADGRFLLVKKPIFNFHVLMAQLGQERLESVANGNPDVGLLATRDEDAITVVYYHHRDRTDHGGFSVPAPLTIDHLPEGTWRLVHESIDEEADYPYSLFVSGPCDPPEPEMQRRYLQTGELRRISADRDITGGGSVTLDLDIHLPSMGMVLLVRDPGSAPPQVTGLRGQSWTGISSDEQIMLRWQRQGNARTLATFEVERQDENGWTRLNPDTRCAAWCDLRSPRAGGTHYRVRAVDLWGRAGEWSESICV